MEYEVFKQRLIEEGFIEANPKRWVRPERHHVNAHFCDKHPAVDVARLVRASTFPV